MTGAADSPRVRPLLDMPVGVMVVGAVIRAGVMVVGAMIRAEADATNRDIDTSSSGNGSAPYWRTVAKLMALFSVKAPEIVTGPEVTGSCT